MAELKGHKGFIPITMIEFFDVNHNARQQLRSKLAIFVRILAQKGKDYGVKLLGLD